MVLKIDTSKFFQVSLIAFAVIEGISFILSQIGVMDFIKAGWIIFIFLLVIILTTLWNFGMNLTSLKIKDLVFMLLVFALIVGLYLLLPILIPQLFSIIPGIEINYSIREFVSRTIGSVGSLMGTSVV